MLTPADNELLVRTGPGTPMKIATFEPRLAETPGPGCCAVTVPPALVGATL